MIQVRPLGFRGAAVRAAAAGKASL